MYSGRPPAVCTESFQCSHLQATHPARAPVTRANTTDLITLSGGLRGPGMYRSHQPHVSPLAYVILAPLQRNVVRHSQISCSYVSRDYTSALRVQWTNQSGLCCNCFGTKRECDVTKCCLCCWLTWVTPDLWTFFMKNVGGFLISWVLSKIKETLLTIFDNGISFCLIWQRNLIKLLRNLILYNLLHGVWMIYT